MASSTRVTKLVDFGSLYFEDNVRTTHCLQIPKMIQSLRRNGFKENHPLVVSEKPAADGYVYLVLCGNRRGLAVNALREEDPAEFARILPNGKIPCIVHKGLTVEEEILLRIDHSEDEDRVALDEWSTFVAIKQLVRAFTGESQEAIATKLGIVHGKGKNAGKPNRSFVQTRVNLARLPDFVQDQFERLMTEGKDATAVRVSDVKALYTAFNAEYADHPDGDGPVFSKVWNGIVNPEPKSEESDSSDKADPVDLTAKSAHSRSQGCASRLVKRILLAATNQGGNMVDLDAQAAQYETDSLILADIRELLGDASYNDLIADAQKARLNREAVQIENAKIAEAADCPAEVESDN